MTQELGNEHKRAVLYLRVSTDEQREAGYGLTGQFNDCVEYAKRLGYQIVGEKSYKLEGGKLIETTDAGATAAYIEDYTGFSRFDDRPTGKQLMAMLKAKQADAFIAARVDRIARDSLEARIAVRTWLKSNIEAHTAQNGRITNDNDIVFMIQSWQGQEDYTKIVKNMREGRNNKAKGGLVVGTARPPYGYHFVRDPKGKVVALEIYEPEARIVRLVFRWYVIGGDDAKPMTQRGIALRLAELGILSPRQNMKQRVCKNTNWTPSTVNRVIGNETYAGTLHYLKMVKRENKMYNRDASEHITINVPAIVDRETWERAQARRQYNAKMSKRNSKHNYFLRGRVECKCGRSMVGHTTTTSRGTKYYYYICASNPYSTKVEQRRCDQKPVRCDNLDNLAWDSVKELFSDPDRLWADLKRAQDAELTDQDPKRAELQAVEEFIAQADQEADEIAATMRIAKGRVGERVQKQQDDLNARIEGYHKRRGELIAELGARKLTDAALTDIVSYAQDVRLGIDEADFETKQRIIELLDVRVKIDGEKTQVTCAIVSPTS
jgi:site-specific DNA recombinase